MLDPFFYKKRLLNSKPLQKSATRDGRHEADAARRHQRVPSARALLRRVPRRLRLGAEVLGRHHERAALALGSVAAVHLQQVPTPRRARRADAIVLGGSKKKRPRKKEGAPAAATLPAAAAGVAGTQQQRVDRVLRDAGISPTDDAPRETADGGAGPADPLARIPKRGQDLLEKVFSGGALASGGVLLVSGIGVGVEAVCKVGGYPIPLAIDEAIVQYVEPTLTPALLTVFFFSISLGVLKQLQFSSDADVAGVLYREEADDD